MPKGQQVSRQGEWLLAAPGWRCAATPSAYREVVKAGGRVMARAVSRLVQVQQYQTLGHLRRIKHKAAG